jgi:hypothetical protein
LHAHVWHFFGQSAGLAEFTVARIFFIASQFHAAVIESCAPKLPMGMNPHGAIS